MQKVGDITSTATPEGEFTDGNVAGGVNPTLLMALWFNTIQRELCNVVTESGGTLDPNDFTQVVEAIKKIAGSELDDKGFLVASKNLSDVLDKSLARQNLELKTAAQKDVQTNHDDTTSGRVLVNGGALALRSVSASGGGGAYTDDCNNLPANSVSFVYGSAKNSPGFEASVLDFAGLGGAYRTQIAASYRGSVPAEGEMTP